MMPLTPHLQAAIEAEQNVLGAILLKPELLGVAQCQIQSVHFADPAHKVIFEAMGVLYSMSKPIDIITVSDEIRGAGELENLTSRGGLEYLTELKASVVVCDPVNIAFHVQAISEAFRRRFAKDLLSSSASATFVDSDLDALIERVRAELEKAKSPPVADVLPATVADVLRSAAFSEPQKTYPTGFTEFDEMIAGGVKARQLTIIAGPTGDGKTGFAGTLARWWAQQGVPVLWCATELDIEEQSARFAAIDFHLRDLAATPDDFLAGRIDATRGAEGYDGLPVRLHNLEDSADEGDPFVAIEMKAVAMRTEYGVPPIIIVDYLQILAVEDENARRMSVTKVATKLRKIAKVVNTPVIGISSVSRSYYGQNKKKPEPGSVEDPRDWLAAAKESGDIEYAASVFCYLDRDRDVNQLGESAARLIVAKSRRGTTGFVGLRFHGPSGAFVPYGGALVAMGPSSRNGKLESRILQHVRSPGYVPMTATALRNFITGAGKTEIGDAIARMIADARLALEEQSKVNSAGKLRPVMVIVAGAKMTRVHEERAYVD